MSSALSRSGFVLTGPADGQTVSWLGDVWYVTEKSRPETQAEAFLSYRLAREPHREKTEPFAYEYIHWGTNEAQIGMWVPQGKDVVWAMKTLIEKYQKRSLKERFLVRVHRALFMYMETGRMTSFEDIKDTQSLLESIEEQLKDKDGE